MGSFNNKKLNLYHNGPTKLSLSSLSSRAAMPPEAPTPPPRTATLSVPFQWEEVPGKPRACHVTTKGSDVARTLELPPRLSLLSAPDSPTTVLDGPYVARGTSFTSSCRANANFGSSRWGGGVKGKDNDEGSFDFSSSTEDGTGKVKITRVRRKGSFFIPSHKKSHLWASIYESFKQVVPWKRTQEKQSNRAPNNINTA